MVYGMHPNLDTQRIMNGGALGIPDRSIHDDGFDFSDIGDALDRTIPRYVAAMMLGAVITLVALRAAGFRFSFGASVGNGG